MIEFEKATQLVMELLDSTTRSCLVIYLLSRADKQYTYTFKLSQVEISRKTGLHRTSVMPIIKYLQSKGILSLAGRECTVYTLKIYNLLYEYYCLDDIQKRQYAERFRQNGCLMTNKTDAKPRIKRAIYKTVIPPKFNRDGYDRMLKELSINPEYMKGKLQWKL